MIKFVDTHAHLDGKEYDGDRDEVVARAKAAGVCRVLIPSIDLPSVATVLETCRRYPGFAYPMIGLHPEEVRGDYEDVLAKMRVMVEEHLPMGETTEECHSVPTVPPRVVAIGEVGLDFYWSREYEREQLDAFERQVRWSVETRLPLMVHCRKAQGEMTRVLRKYERDLPGGVFHCFTGNGCEAAELLRFKGFMLGIGGVLTFKKSKLPEVLPSCVPLSRIVLETDSPYMSPVPKRGCRNESAFVCHVLRKLSECYGVSEQEVADITNRNVRDVFGV